MGVNLPRPDSLLTVGWIRRAHGLQGEVVVRLSTNRTERLDPGTILFTADGSLEVEASRPNGVDHLVVFAGVADRTDAERLRGSELLAEPFADPEELWVHELIGSTVTDQTGTNRGVVREVEANPASDLLVLDSGALVPVRFITSTERGAVTVDVPDGLFDL